VIAKKDSSIGSIKDLKGKKVAIWYSYGDHRLVGLPGRA
jgi:ABC-type nitrate/sulfonate/bicarbonate transport system substrate-binding protein